ncbi:MAG: cell surface protein SprA, partial [Calditrichaeota bacterium]|nr:cell surface protein SprA [Calditrichota bacterium]
MSKKENIEDDDPNPTDYSFKVDQKQEFIIKGKVGEKVAVDINQDSERLFDFENNLSVKYTGDEDEIIKSIEAGNISLSLGGANLISGSSRHQGLFGLKTVSQFGALKLTTIASLEKGEKQQISIEGGAQSSGKKTIYPGKYAQNLYFFLDDYYRELYQYRSVDLLPFAAPDSHKIAVIEVYKSISNSINITEGSDYSGWALFDPDEPDFNPDSSDSDALHQSSNFEQLREGSDYYVDMARGYIRMNNLSSSDILAVAYSKGTHSTGIVTVGDLMPDNQKKNIFKLIKTKNPQPTDSTWNLMWRNVYSLRGTNIDPEEFDLRITISDVNENKNRESGLLGTEEQKKTYLEMFGLDFYNEGGGNSPDGRIEDVFINYERGELIFPDLTPFHPQGWFRGDTLYFGKDTIKAPLVPAEDNDSLYITIERELGNTRYSRFQIEVEYKSVSSTYQLSFNVLKGSVEVYLNGQQLAEGSDYTVDYISGELTILRSQALSADSDISITFENAALFQLDTKTLLGIRAEYELWENSHLGITAMHLNESTMDRRIRVGGEPKQNSIWDVNFDLNFKPMFLTKAVDWLPLIETDDASTFSINGEFAQIFPNPNSLNSSSTGDNNGVAYVDDFESIKRITPLGINRSQWTAASYPEEDTRVRHWEPYRGRMIWFNPWDQIDITDIWPDKETQAQASKIQTLRIQFKPWWNDWNVDSLTAVTEADTAGAPLYAEYWGGIMRYLGSGYADQSDAKYLEIWLNRHDAIDGSMYIDLGTISEDVIPDGKLNTEDLPSPGKNLGNGVLTPDEDTGIDTVEAADPIDLIDVNGDGRLLPSYDDWEYGSNRNDYSHINGTEGNKIDEVGRYPDSEDLNNDTNVGRANDFFRYTIDFSEGNANRYIVGGIDNTKGWRLYRIPLKDNFEVGEPQMSNLEYARIWFTGFARPLTVTVEIAQIDIVGNEWQEVEVSDGRGGKFDPVSISVINSEDNKDKYVPPPGVTGERDPITGFIEKEQSLVLKIERLRSGESGQVIKNLSHRQSMNLIEYRQLKMFINLVDEYGRDRDLELFFRFGVDANSKYYEYSRRLKPGWQDNEVIIDLNRLTSLNSLRQEDSLRT